MQCTLYKYLTLGAQYIKNRSHNTATGINHKKKTHRLEMETRDNWGKANKQVAKNAFAEQNFIDKFHL